METVATLIRALQRLPATAKVRFHDGTGDIRKITVAPYIEDEPDVVWIGLGFSRRRQRCNHGVSPVERCHDCD